MNEAVPANADDKQESIKHITPEVLSNLVEKNILPTIKAILYDKEGRISVYESDKEKHSGMAIANFVGGGIDDDESPAKTLEREFREELDANGYERVAIDDLDTLPILTFGTVPTGKKKWNSKGVFMTAIEVESLERVTPQAGELRGPHVFNSIKDAIEWMSSGADNRIELTSLYRTALEELESRFY